MINVEVFLLSHWAPRCATDNILDLWWFSKTLLARASAQSTLVGLPDLIYFDSVLHFF